jgi:hypothetical protein
MRRSAHSQEAIPTIDWPSLGWPERHGRFDPTKSAFYSDLDALARERMTVRLHVGRDSLILSHLAGLAPLWIVSQPFVCKE